MYCYCECSLYDKVINTNSKWVVTLSPIDFSSTFDTDTVVLT